MAKEIRLTKTEGEWNRIGEIAKSKGFTDIKSFMRYQTIKMINQFRKCPDCVTVADGDKQSKSCYLNESYYQTLQEMSKQLKRPINTIVDDLIITPLLSKDDH